MSGLRRRIPDITGALRTRLITGGKTDAQPLSVAMLRALIRSAGVMASSLLKSRVAAPSECAFDGPKLDDLIRAILELSRDQFGVKPF